jgi:hypothetical protein
MGTKGALVVAVSAAMVPVVQSAAVAKSQCDIRDGGACSTKTPDPIHLEPAPPATYAQPIGITVTDATTGRVLNT